jgi:hypothetical protein
MKTLSKKLTGTLLSAGLIATTGGCIAAAAGAAAGAAGAIAFTQRGAETNLEASLDETVQATERVFDGMDIVLTERTESGDTDVTLTGETGDTTVVVEIGPGADGLTHVHVTARESAVDYDTDRAEEVLRRIVEEV